MSIAVSLLASFLAAGLATWLFTPLIIRLYRRYGWDKPHHSVRQSIKDTHRGQIPRGGGLAIFSGLLVGTLIFLPWDIHHVAIFVACLLLTIIGWLDDIYDISPFWRLGVNFLAAGLLVTAGITIDFVTDPRGGILDLTFWSWLPTSLTLFYLVALTNITNWAKGIDGQLPGVVVIAAIFIGVLSLRLSDNVNSTAFFSFLVAGSFAGFLWWNFYPQKIMPGYGGGSLAGFLLGTLSILAGAKIATLAMVLALPIADALFTVLRRFLAGKSIFLGDRGHLHHKLLDKLHWGRRRIAIFYWLVTLLMGILTLLLPTNGKIVAFLLVVALVFYFLIRLRLREKM